MTRRRVVLVTGPPCSGRTRHVGTLAKPGELIVSHRVELAHARSNHPRLQLAEQRAIAAERYDQLVATLPSYLGRAWVIAGVPDPTERGQLAARIRADEVVVLLPSLDVVLNRASLDQRERSTYAEIRRWFGQYAPRADDLVLRPAGAPAW